MLHAMGLEHIKLVPPTASRVEQNTPDSVNREIEDSTLIDMMKVMGGGPQGIARRLEELDREWDIERALEASDCFPDRTSDGLKVHRGWFALPVVVAAFLLQHAIQDWCPPLPIMRKLGFRTAREINAEKTALRISNGNLGGRGFSLGYASYG